MDELPHWWTDADRREYALAVAEYMQAASTPCADTDEDVDERSVPVGTTVH
jgi:hypothetical protein